MATSYIFDNKRISIPGAYSVIKSGIKNPPIDLEFGNALIIDAGSGAKWGGGAGINGELDNGKDALYTFTNTQDFQRHVAGGLWWWLCQPMFFPGGGAAGGVSSLTIVKAATTTASTMVFNPTGGGANGGTVTMKTRMEGLGANGVRGDETRAQSTLTVSNAGATADTIDIVVGGVTVAAYENAASDNIATVVAGLVASMIALDEVQVISSSGTQIVFTQRIGAGADTSTPTVNVTGAMAANATAYSGGVNGTKLTRGFSFKMRAGVVDTSKYIIDFYQGSYNGRDGAINLNSAGDFGNLAEEDTEPRLLVSSDEFSTMQEFLTWVQGDAAWNFYFYFVSGTATGTGAIDAADLATFSAENLAAGGTETYGSTDLDAVLANIADEPFDFILLEDWGDNAMSANNVKIQAYANTQANVKPDLYIGGGNDSSKWTQALGSIPTAQFFNDEAITVVHGAVGIPDTQEPTGFREYASIAKAAFILGREAGIPPQVPITFKSIGIGKELHNLTKSEITGGLDAGVVMTRRVGSTFDIVKGVNSLQLNTNLVNPDGSTSSKQIRRIARQLNKELVFNVNTQLLKNPNGSNRNTLSEQDVESFLNGYLKGKVATDTADDLILDYGNIVVNTVGDSYQVTYEIVPNFEVSFVFLTGFLIDPTSN